VKRIDVYQGADETALAADEGKAGASALT